MVLAALGAAAGQYAMAKIEQNSQNAAAKKATRDQMLFNYWMQQKQLDWEHERATHAHQWEMQDLKAANLNPALTATGGSGATTGTISAPTSAMPNYQGLQMGSFTDLVGRMVDMKNNTKATNANANLADAQALKTLTENKLLPEHLKNETIKAMADKIKADADATNAVTNRTRSNAGIWSQWFGGENAERITKDMYRHVQRKEGDWFHFELKKKN